MGLMESGPDAGTCCVVTVVLSCYQSCHYPCHSVSPGYQAGLMMGGGGQGVRLPFEIADSQYQLCPYFELPKDKVHEAP